jgi:hypothetical protein
VTPRHLLTVPLALALAGCPAWVTNRSDGCAPGETRCHGGAAQVCGPAGSTRWATVSSCQAPSRAGEAQTCCYVEAPEAQFRGYTCAPASRCMTPPDGGAPEGGSR